MSIFLIVRGIINIFASKYCVLFKRIGIRKATRVLHFKDLEQMSSDDVHAILDSISISEEQAKDSDYDGDSDADDVKLHTTFSSTPRRSRNSTQPSTSAVSMDWDNDDSLNDPDFKIILL